MIRVAITLSRQPEDALDVLFRGVALVQARVWKFLELGLAPREIETLLRDGKGQSIDSLTAGRSSSQRRVPPG